MASRTPLTAVTLACLWLVLPATGLAQGNGNGRPKGPKPDKPAAPAPAPAPTPTAPSDSGGSSSTSTPAPQPVTASDALPGSTVLATATTFRQFGAWLDDTSAGTPGEGQTSVGVGHWRMQGMTQTNLPMLGVNVGVTDRLQVGALLPFYRVSYAGGSASGVDDIYLNAKYTIVDPTLTLSEVGLAVSPVVEVLSPGIADGRVHFALPVSVEVRREPYRVYGSAGYFTRGSVFMGGALEWTSPSRLTLTGAFTQSYSVKADPTLDALGVSTRRADVTGSVAYPFGRVAVGYVSVARTLTSIAEGGTTFSVAGGVAVRFNGGIPHRP
jgi:hypothetical protein